MVALSCLLVAVWRIGALAAGAVLAAADVVTGATLGCALLIVWLSPLAALLPLGPALVAALVGSLATAAVLSARAPQVAPGPTPPSSGAAVPLALAALAGFGLIAARGYFYDELDHH